jgi:hypothetical protein
MSNLSDSVKITRRDLRAFGAHCLKIRDKQGVDQAILDAILADKAEALEVFATG